jgi:hypothetical protein
LGEEYRSLSSSLCSFLHSFVTSSLLAQIFSCFLVIHPVLKHPQPTFLPQFERPSFIPIKLIIIVIISHAYYVPRSSQPICINLP